MRISLVPLEEECYERFIADNQRAFKFGAMAAMGEGDDEVKGEEIISREVIEESVRGLGNDSYQIVCDREVVGGLVVHINAETQHNELLLLFVLPEVHDKGIGLEAWKAVENRYPKTKVWETCTPYFEKRNIHFYVNKCGFHIVEFFNDHHCEVNTGVDKDGDEMFRFEKVMNEE